MYWTNYLKCVCHIYICIVCIMYIYICLCLTICIGFYLIVYHVYLCVYDICTFSVFHLCRIFFCHLIYVCNHPYLKGNQFPTQNFGYIICWISGLHHLLTHLVSLLLPKISGDSSRCRFQQIVGRSLWTFEWGSPHQKPLDWAKDGKTFTTSIEKPLTTGVHSGVNSRR